MGGHVYTPATFKTRTATAAAANVPLFHHTTVSNDVHPSLDVSKKNASGKLIRESRDSDIHPDSVAVWVNFDGTGSMYEHPSLFAKKLADLMATLVKDGWLVHPHILVSQNCDFGDAFPFQAGQFEGGNQLDEALTNMQIKSGGNGYPWDKANHEAYTLPLFFAAYHSSIDCYEKRGKKGYMFILGDELIPESILPEQVEKIFGIKIEKAISRDQLLADVRKMYNLHWIIPSGTMHFDDKSVTDRLEALFGQNFHRLENPEAVCEFIAGLIAYQEGFEIEDIKDALVNIGGDPMAAKAAGNALALYAKNTGLVPTKSGSASDELVEAEETGSTRL